MKVKPKKLKKTPEIPAWIMRDNTPTQTQIDLLRGSSIMLGTPMYGGMCSGNYAVATATTQMYADRLGVKMTIQALFNESLVQRGRNAITHFFMRSAAEYLLFVDADITYSPVAVLELMLAHKLTGERLIGGTYSKKEINWPQVRKHIANGVQDKYLAHCAGSHVIIPNEGHNQEISYYNLFPVQYLGTGFMLMHRSIFEDVAPYCKTYKNNHIPTVPQGEIITAYFDCEVRNEVYLSEDYLFCARAKDAGIVPKLAPWVMLEHFGSYNFNGCFICTQEGYVHPVREQDNKGASK